MADDVEKTEPATPKKREDARKKGEVAQSKELASVVVLAVALLSLTWVLGDELLARLAGQAQVAWNASGRPVSTLDGYHHLLILHFGGIGLVLVPLLGLLAVSAIAIQMVQVGPMFSVEALQFRGEKLDPIKGMKRLVSVDRLMDLGKSFLKMFIVGGITWWVLEPHWGRILGLAGVDLGESLVVAKELSWEVGGLVLLAMAFLAVADLAWVRYRFEKKLRMSKQEVRDELKQREGSPQVRARIRAAQKDLSRSRMIAAVADADVVITNPTHYAVALKYERQDMGAPRVLAKGRNHVARRIRQVAEEHGVPIVENPPLAQLLHKTAKLGREIPEALYQAVAEVLAYVFRLDARRSANWGVQS